MKWEISVNNMVILGLPFINALYPFLVEHDGITADPFGQKVKFKFASKFEIDIDNLSYQKDSPMNELVQELIMKSDDFKGNFHNTKLLKTIHYPNNINDSLQELDNDAWINTTNKWDNNNNIIIYTTSKWIIMEKKNKGKARPCLLETLIFRCCVPFLPSLVPP